MNKKVFIINGSGGAGKDSFVKFSSDALNNIMKKFHTVINFSSIDKVKEIAKEIGWEGLKTEKDRKFLSDLKKLSTNYCDMPFQSMKKRFEEFCDDDNSYILFLHIREPEEINRAVKEFNAKTVLIVRDSIKQIISNSSDKSVFKYNYDFVIKNNGTLDDLKIEAKKFVEKIWEDENKIE